MNKPSRRAVVRTGVWAVPVVATAAAAPAFAGTDNPPPVQISAVGSVCKDPGEGQNTKDYEFTISFTNNAGTAQTVHFVHFLFKGKDNVPLSDVVVPAGASNWAYTVKLTNFDDSSSNPVAVVDYTVSSTGGVVYEQEVTFSTPIHPCK
jgi:hypothetical protein